MTMFIEHQQAILAEINELIKQILIIPTAGEKSQLFALLQTTNRRLIKETTYAKDKLLDDSFDELSADYAHFTQAPSNSLFGLSVVINAQEGVPSFQSERLLNLAGENLRLHGLNQAILFSEHNDRLKLKTAVSLLECLQKPTTINKPVCIQISGAGARQSILACPLDIQTAFNQLFWVLAGKVPNNHVWVESERLDTAVKLQLWNESITLKPASLERYEQLINAPTIYQINDLNGAIPPLAAAQKLISQNGGQLIITNGSPTKIELQLPLD